MAAARAQRRPSVPDRIEQGTLDDARGRGREAGYRGPQVCKIVGITYRQLDYWARTDLVRPSLADARGSGTQRRYSYRDLVRLKVIKSLLDAGVKLQTARKAIEYLRDDLGDDWADGQPRARRHRTRCSRAPATTSSTSCASGQGVLNIVPLGQVVEELDASIHELATRTATPAGTPRRASTAQRGEGG